ncbi:hypothetical protein M406DRAFT_249998 [Cryphonectria parasitica EP155]|uniref:non-specific serine/threonine protein kinase n=1 Tax=Cryphonectria parasitica (strain ATCC 38755 / EP155) TaxID=660469 RepID=A0A9P4Y897_CRYP1|nr:uncharacterized protein M406DRAFT_249998 [Cryphonectria parasitica EP155]KAF3768239.1 hypothetical protein M406DRAFT_249998 [Cryphonectria parasitica EP155]
MADQPRSEIIKGNPIGKGLDAFRAFFDSICKDRSLACSASILDQLDRKGKDRPLPVKYPSSDTSRLLPSRGSGNNLLSDLSRLISVVNSDDLDLNRIKPLLNAALADSPDDALIWDQVYHAVTESTPPPRPIASSVQQTPLFRNTSSFANSSEYRKYVDDVLKEELGVMYVGLPHFDQTYFGDVVNLETASEAFFKECKEGASPLFRAGWTGWPKSANQNNVLNWFVVFSERLSTFAASYKSTIIYQRRPLARPNQPIDGSTAQRKMDIGFVDNPDAGKYSRCHWSQILVPGELKSNPSADKTGEAWLDLGRYAREVLAAQYNRRFVLGFTICGSLMRIWEFDRLGGIASEQFDINKDGYRFVYTILGFLWMSKEQLGFDPTIITSSSTQYMEIERHGQTERLIIDKHMKRAPCIAGRATTCWKAHREDDPLQTPLVIKDSWQFVEREEEGELLREATERGVINVARYYYHETVQVQGSEDDIESNIRGGLDITTATNYKPEPPPSANPPQTGRSGSATGCSSNSTTSRKRSLSQTDALSPTSKRSCPPASHTRSSSKVLPNRIHRRIIVRDYGKPIYKASSPAALLRALAGCIEGHESLHKAGFLHRDISHNNLMINEDSNNPSWPSFLIDLDLAIKEEREGASGAKGKTGTRAFMAIGVLFGEQHSFMHDLESFFWVLFWICIHYDGPDSKGRVVERFDKWNYMETEELASSKIGVIADEEDFLVAANKNFTDYYQLLVPWVNRLRRMVFPDRQRWKKPEPDLYTQMKVMLREAAEVISK